MVILAKSTTFCPFHLQAKIHETLVNVFQTVTAYSPPRGIGAYSKSRAMYAVDLLLEWKREQGSSSSTTSCNFNIEPRICEVNFIPDCTRACYYYPNFHNDVFNFLFLDQVSEDIVQIA